MSTPHENDFQRQIAARIVEQIRSGESFLVNKCEAGDLKAPVNAVTGKPYSSINRLILTTPGGDDPRWMTKNQAEQQGYIIKDGAKPRKLVFWETTKKVAVKGDDGKPERDYDGQVKTKTVRLERPEMRFYDVYPAKGLIRPDGQELPPYEDKRDIGDPITQAQVILANSGAEMDHSGGGTAGFYSPDRDKLVMPSDEFMPSREDERQALAIHALCGQICQKNGLAPDDPFWHQSPQQVETHLQVVIASLYATEDLGLPSRPFGDGKINQRVLSVWASAVEKDPNMLFRACANAEKIKTQVLSLEQTVSQEQTPKEPVKLSVPFTQRQEAKELGAYFHREEKLWVSSPDNKNLTDLTSRWPHDPEKHQKKGNQEQKAPKRAYLDVPFEEKDRAKDLGAMFDFKKKQWFVEPDKDLSPFIEWLSDKDRQTLPVLSPEEEFAVVLEKAGLVLDGPPLMDGKPHKVKAVGQKRGAPQATYCFMPEPGQTGFYMNHHSNESNSWTYSGQMLSEAKKAELVEELTERKAEISKTRTVAPKKTVARTVDKQADELNKATPAPDKTQAPDQKKGLGR